MKVVYGKKKNLYGKDEKQRQTVFDWGLLLLLLIMGCWIVGSNENPLSVQRLDEQFVQTTIAPFYQQCDDNLITWCSQKRVALHEHS